MPEKMKQPTANSRRSAWCRTYSIQEGQRICVRGEIVSLWDIFMISTRVDRLLQARASLESTALAFTHKLPDAGEMLKRSGIEITPEVELMIADSAATRRQWAEIGDKAWLQLGEDLHFLHEFCEVFELASSLAQIRRTAVVWTKDDRGRLAGLLPDLWRRLEDETKAALFLGVRARLAPYYSTLGHFTNDVAEAFCHCEQDIEEANKCFALERWTASVFHCMRILEIGLHAFAKKLRIQKRLYQAENWQNVIEVIEKRVAQEKLAKKGPAKQRRLTDYSQAAAQFMYFKNAWRNHVAHARVTYTEDSARRILDHTQQFMEALVGMGIRA